MKERNEEGKVCSWYGPCGSLVVNVIVPGVTDGKQDPTSNSYYGGKYLIGESMSRAAAITISNALGFAFMGDIGSNGETTPTLREKIDALYPDNQAIRNLMYWKFADDGSCGEMLRHRPDYCAGNQEFANDVCGLLDIAGDILVKRN
jgi:hypothetical protein